MTATRCTPPPPVRQSTQEVDSFFCGQAKLVWLINSYLWYTRTCSCMINGEFWDSPSTFVSGSGVPVVTCLQCNIICTSRKWTKRSGSRIAKLNTVANYQKYFALNTHSRLCQWDTKPRTRFCGTVCVVNPLSQSVCVGAAKGQRNNSLVYLVVFILVGDL